MRAFHFLRTTRPEPGSAKNTLIIAIGRIKGSWKNQSIPILVATAIRLDGRQGRQGDCILYACLRGLNRFERMRQHTPSNQETQYTDKAKPIVKCCLDNFHRLHLVYSLEIRILYEPPHHENNEYACPLQRFWGIHQDILPTPYPHPNA
jgi:hypothetical protein